MTTPDFSEALIAAGSATGSSAYISAGLRSLGWLTGRQKSPTGLFRPVGTDSFHDVRAAGGIFDQQPIEATATIAACLAAQRLTEDPRWSSEAQCAFDWFFGGNDLWEPLVDIETGSCRDGLHPDRRNENRGGEFGHILPPWPFRHAQCRADEGIKPPRGRPVLGRAYRSQSVISQFQRSSCRKQPFSIGKPSISGPILLGLSSGRSNP